MSLLRLSRAWRLGRCGFPGVRRTSRASFSMPPRSSDRTESSPATERFTCLAWVSIDSPLPAIARSKCTTLAVFESALTYVTTAVFPSRRAFLTLLGADLIVLPTNWPTSARGTVRHLVQARALENHVYYMAVNRTGQERGFQFIGQSRIVNFDGELLAFSENNAEEILYADLDPKAARQKQVVNIPGKYEINRVADRRPEMYGVLCNQMP